MEVPAAGAAAAAAAPEAASLAEADQGQTGINSGRWTREEHALFLHGLATHGKEWKKISEMIKTRTVVQIRTHAQKYFQKVAKNTGGPVMSTSKKGDVVRPARKQRKGEEGDDPAAAAAAGAAAAAATPASSAAPAAAQGVLSPATTLSPSAAGTAAAVGNPVSGKKTTPKKPSNIRVPAFQKPAPAAKPGPSKLRIDSNKKAKGDEGGVTPRTVAAATILLRPRIQHKLQSGSDTPKTREQATWLRSQEMHAARVLGKRPRASTPSGNSPVASDSKPVLSWEAAATNP